MTVEFAKVADDTLTNQSLLKNMRSKGMAGQKLAIKDLLKKEDQEK